MIRHTDAADIAPDPPADLQPQYHNLHAGPTRLVHAEEDSRRSAQFAYLGPFLFRFRGEGI
jgi:hypothetical protein